MIAEEGATEHTDCWAKGLGAMRQEGRLIVPKVHKSQVPLQVTSTSLGEQLTLAARMAALEAWCPWWWCGLFPLLPLSLLHPMCSNVIGWSPPFRFPFLSALSFIWWRTTSFQGIDSSVGEIRCPIQSRLNLEAAIWHKLGQANGSGLECEYEYMTHERNDGVVIHSSIPAAGLGRTSFAVRPLPYLQLHRQWKYCSTDPLPTLASGLSIDSVSFS